MSEPTSTVTLFGIRSTKLLGTPTIIENYIYKLELPYSVFGQQHMYMYMTSLFLIVMIESTHDHAFISLL